MIWRLLASVMALTDTGSIAVTSEHTDWPTEVQCNEVLQKFYTASPPQQIDGHRITVRISGVCVPVIDGHATEYVARPQPPPVDCRYLIGGRVPQPGCLPPGITNPYVR